MLDPAWMLVAAVMCQAAPDPAADAPTEAEVRLIASEAIADARTRDTLQPGSLHAGHDGVFFIAGDDGRFRLNVGGLVQFRYAYTHRSGSGEDDDQGFFFPRVRLWFNGSIAEGVTFRIRGQFSGTEKVGYAQERTVGGQLELDQAWVNLRLNDRWGLRFGQQASEFSRENELAPQDQLGVNASPTDATYGFGGYEGVRLAYQDDALRVFATYSDGMRNKNTDYTDPRNADFAMTLKAECLLAGAWSRFNDFTSRPGEEFAMMLGAGVHWENGAEIGDPAERTSLLGGIVELSLEGDGWTLFGAGHAFRNTFLSPDGRGLYDYGLVVQGGVYLAERIEPFVRFDAVFPDSDRVSRNQEFKTLTAGFNYYPFPGSNAAKFSFDIMYMFDDEAGSLVNPSSNAGVLASNSDDQLTIRAQFSLVF